jgi:MFS family permease
MFLLGSSTVGVALLPGYRGAGVLAIALRTLCRTGQGLARGGSWGGLPSLLVLNAPEKRRGWYAMTRRKAQP